MRPHTEPESMRIHALDTRNTIVHDIKLAISLASTTKSCKTGREAKAQRATKITGDPRITAGDQGSTKREPWAGQQQCRALMHAPQTKRREEDGILRARQETTTTAIPVAQEEPRRAERMMQPPMSRPCAGRSGSRRREASPKLEARRWRRRRRGGR